MKTGFCAMSASRLHPARRSPWSAIPAPARRRSPICCCASTTCSAARIRIGGVDVRDFDLAELRRQFGIVLQDPYLFTGTIAEQHPARHRRHHGRGTSKLAAEQVNLMDFIDRLPEGFAEPVRERGNGLSTGQKQLISFARALAHDPRYPDSR